jgi:hypothetical protein
MEQLYSRSTRQSRLLMEQLYSRSTTHDRKEKKLLLEISTFLIVIRLPVIGYKEKKLLLSSSSVFSSLS